MGAVLQIEHTSLTYTICYGKEQRDLWVFLHQEELLLGIMFTLETAAKLHIKTK